MAFGNSCSTLTKILPEKICETTYRRWFSGAVIKTTVTGINHAGPFPCLFPRAHGQKDLLPKIFACWAIIVTSGTGEWMFTNPSLMISLYHCTLYSLLDLYGTTDKFKKERQNALITYIVI